jgi:hypothetical protein
MQHIELAVTMRHHPRLDGVVAMPRALQQVVLSAATARQRQRQRPT